MVPDCVAVQHRAAYGVDAESGAGAGDSERGAGSDLHASCAFEFSVFTFGADVIIDVVGYFAAPVATALQCTPVASSPTAIPVSADTLVALPSCAAGYTRTGSSCSGTAGIPGGYLLETNTTGCLFRNLSSVTTY